MDGNAWGTAYAMGGPRMPVWRLVGEHNPKADILVHPRLPRAGVAGQMLTGTNDSPLCVVDRASGFTLFCANADQVGSRRIRATAAPSPTTRPTASTTATRARTTSATSPAAAGSPTPW